jgi:hypothetical protein
MYVRKVPDSMYQIMMLKKLITNENLIKQKIKRAGALFTSSA